jgi:hypothetical protein
LRLLGDRCSSKKKLPLGRNITASICDIASGEGGHMGPNLPTIVDTAAPSRMSRMIRYSAACQRSHR